MPTENREEPAFGPPPYACWFVSEPRFLEGGKITRSYLIAEGIAAAVQCLVVWLVVTIADHKLDREWDEAFERWRATDHNAAGSADGVMEMLSRGRGGPAGTTMLSIARPNGSPCRFRPPRPRGRGSRIGC